MQSRLPRRRAILAAGIYPFIAVAVFILAIILDHNGEWDLPPIFIVIFYIFTFPALFIAELLGERANTVGGAIFLLVSGSIFWGLITYGFYRIRNHLRKPKEA